MAKKTFIATTRLVKGERWYIDYQTYDADTGKNSRHRQDFDLNDIANLEVRELVGNILCKHLQKFVPGNKKAQAQEPVNTETVKQAVQIALAAKLTSPRKNTHRGYRSITKAFLEWVTKRNYADLPAAQFSAKHARAFFDYVSGRRAYSGRTLNNYLIHMRAIFSEIIAREMAEKNPFTAIKPVRVAEKNRRCFEGAERVAVARHIQETDYWMFRALLLQYYCYIRPVEISRLRFKSFDLGTGAVTVESFEAKKWKKRVATIPASVMHYFRDGVFDRQPGNYYIIGNIDNRSIGPSPKPAMENRMYTRHRKVLLLLKSRGVIKDITGLTWYSWKDTGISVHARKTTPLATRDQAGHGSFDMTLTYYEAEKVNSEYRGMTDDLFE